MVIVPSIFSALLLLLEVAPSHAQLWQEAGGPTCVPQGMLLLDEPYPSPIRPNIILPFCQKYQACSCCNASHVLTIQKVLSHSVVDNPDLPLECKQSLEEISCRVCDPEVGVGQKEVTCKSKCNEWFTSCKNQFFSYAHSSGKLVPCRDDDSSPMICTHLEELIADGEEFCEAISIRVSKTVDEDCWDGPTLEDSGLCDGVPLQPAFWWLKQMTWMPVTIATLFFFWLLPRITP